MDCSTSGKMGKANLQKFINDCLLPELNEENILIQDSWTGQRDQTQFENLIPDGKAVYIATIPPKATKYCQPLDLYFFRQFKLVVRRLTDSISYSSEEDVNIRLNDRKFIIKMLSLVYNQFCSSRFHNMILYAWKKSGFTIEKELVSFESASEVLFKHQLEDCAFQYCSKIALLSCSHCRKFFCAEHCINPTPHLHL